MREQINGPMASSWTPPASKAYGRWKTWKKKRTKRFDGWQSKQSLRVEIKPLAALRHATKNNIKHTAFVHKCWNFKKYVLGLEESVFPFSSLFHTFFITFSYHFACFASVFLTSKPPTGEAQSRHSREGTVAIACESSWLTNYESIKIQFRNAMKHRIWRVEGQWSEPESWETES